MFILDSECGVDFISFPNTFFFFEELNEERTQFLKSLEENE